MRSAGTTTSNMIGPISRPPTTTVASGRCTSLPMRWRSRLETGRMIWRAAPTALAIAAARRVLPGLHSNLKTWLLGTHHGVSPHHLQAYLNEFVFRFNRRFYPMTAFNSALGLAAHASAPTYKNLYSGDWTHPAT